MANQSTTGFGLRPIAKIGQNDNNAGLSEWNIAASSAAISPDRRSRPNAITETVIATKIEI